MALQQQQQQAMAQQQQNGGAVMSQATRALLTVPITAETPVQRLNELADAFQFPRPAYYTVCICLTNVGTLY
jgi:hypothetical protein